MCLFQEWCFGKKDTFDAVFNTLEHFMSSFMVPGGCGNKKVNGTGRWGNFTIHMAPGDGSYFQEKQ